MKFLGGVMSYDGRGALTLDYSHHIDKMYEVEFDKKQEDDQLLGRHLHSEFRSVLGI